MTNTNTAADTTDLFDIMDAAVPVAPTADMLAFDAMIADVTTAAAARTRAAKIASLRLGGLSLYQAEKALDG